MFRWLKEDRHKFMILTALAVVFFILITTIMIVHKNTPDYIELPDMEWKGSMTQEADGSWYVDEEMAQKGVVLYGPYMDIEKGDYTLTVDYDCDKNNYIDVNSNGYSDYVLSGEVPLNHLSNQISFNIRIKERLDDFEIRVKYEGKGYIKVKNIALYKNFAGITRTAVIAISGILFLLVFCLKKDMILANKKQILWVFAVSLLSTVPMFARGLCYGHDGGFHITRIEGIAQGLLEGQFPVRLQSLWMEGYGYPVSIFYGDILLYIPAILRILGFSVTESYKFYLFLINLGTMTIAQVCFAHMVQNKKAASIGAAAYTLATYRFINMYVRVAVGEYTAMMFLPIVLCAIWRMYTEWPNSCDNETQASKIACQKKEQRRNYINALLFTIGMTGVIETHIISVLMVCILIAVFALFMYRKTFTKVMIFTYIRAGIMTLGLNLFFIVPFLDYYKNVPIKVTAGSEEEIVRVIEHKGAYIGQYFMLYQESTGGAKTNIGDRMGLTPGIVLMLALFAAVYLCVKGTSRLLRVLTMMSVLALFMASNRFPWNDIINNVPFMEWIAKIQFPFRFLSLAQVLLAILLCKILTELEDKINNNIYPIAALAMIIVSFQLCTSVIQDRPYTMVYDAAQAGTFNLGSGEYLREDTNKNHLDGQLYTNDVFMLEHYQKDGTYMEFQCETGNNGGAWVELPVLNYPGYVARDGYGNPLDTMDGDNNVLRVLLPENYSGWVMVDFESPWYYRLAELGSVLCIVYLVFRTKWMLGCKHALEGGS